MNFLKRKQVQLSFPKCPESPKDDSITSLETYARDKLIYEMHILNNFLESLYKEPERLYGFNTNYSRDDKWVKICNNHIDYVKDILNSNYGNGTTKKCRYCDKVFQGYMAGAMLEYHNNAIHKKELEQEGAINMAIMGTFAFAILNSITFSFPNTNSNTIKE